MVGSGMFMWRRRLPRPQSAKLCLVGEYACAKWLTQSLEVRYARKWVKNAFIKRDRGS